VDDLEEDLKKIGIRGRRRMAEDREGWRQAIAEVQAVAPQMMMTMMMTMMMFPYVQDYTVSLSKRLNTHESCKLMIHSTADMIKQN
jgi:hypothetical protein